MTISSQTRKAGPYVGSGSTGPYSFTFKVFQASDLLVVKVDTATNIETTLTLTTDYTVSLNDNQNTSPGGTITLVSALAVGFEMVISSQVPYTQETDLTNQGGFYPEVITDALDKLTIQTQQLNEEMGRTAKLPITSAEDVDALVADIIRLADSASNIDTVGNNIASVNAVAGNNANVTTVATNIASVNTTAGSIANVNAVAGNATNINAVAGNATNINAVNANKTNIDAVAGNATNINAVNANKANIDSVAGNATNINAVAADATDIGTVASNIGYVQTIATDLGGSGFDYDLGSITDPATGPSGTPDGFIVTVFNNLADIQTVAGIDGEVSSVAAISTEVVAVDGNATNINAVAADLLGTDTIGTVAGIAGNVTAVANISTDVTAVAGDATDIGLVAGQISPTNNIGTVAGQATNIAALGPISADITTVAGDSADIQSLATKTVQIQVIGDDLAGTGFNYDLGSVVDPAIGPGASPDGYLVTVYNNIADIQAVAAIDDDITIVADNVADITNFADVYQGPKSSDPSLRNDGSALQAGDLYFNTADVLMKVYSGTVWIGAYSGLGDLAYLDTVDTAQIEDGAITSSKLDSTLDLGAIA